MIGEAHSRGAVCRRANPAWVSLALFLFSSFFISRPASAYRTAAQLPEISSADPVRWTDSQIVFDVYTPGSVSLDTANIYEAMVTAFPPWEAVAHRC